MNIRENNVLNLHFLYIQGLAEWLRIMLVLVAVMMVVALVAAKSHKFCAVQILQSVSS